MVCYTAGEAYDDAIEQFNKNTNGHCRFESVQGNWLK